MITTTRMRIRAFSRSTFRIAALALALMVAAPLAAQQPGGTAAAVDHADGAQGQSARLERGAEGQTAEADGSDASERAASDGARGPSSAAR